MTTTLITGANKGLGFETARRLIAAGHTVYASSRDAERGHRAAGRLGARMVLIDVTDDASVDAAAKTIEADGGLDVLVNNAGIEIRTEGNVVPGAAEITARLMRSLFETNVFGVVRVTHAFLPLLRRAAAPAVVRQSKGCRRRPGSTICEPWTISTSVAHCRCGKGPAHRVRPRRGSSYSNTAGFTCGTCTGSSRSGAEAHGQMAVGAQPAGRTEPAHQSGSCRS